MEESRAGDVDMVAAARQLAPHWDVGTEFVR